MSKKEEENFRHQLPACLNNLLRFLLWFVLQWLLARRNIKLTSHPLVQHLNSGAHFEKRTAYLAVSDYKRGPIISLLCRKVSDRRCREFCPRINASMNVR
jgi:hypothetical protein